MKSPHADIRDDEWTGLLEISTRPCPTVIFGEAPNKFTDPFPAFPERYMAYGRMVDCESTRVLLDEFKVPQSLYDSAFRFNALPFDWKPGAVAEKRDPMLPNDAEEALAKRRIDAVLQHLFLSPGPKLVAAFGKLAREEVYAWFESSGMTWENSNQCKVEPSTRADTPRVLLTAHPAKRNKHNHLSVVAKSVSHWIRAAA